MFAGVFIKIQKRLFIKSRANCRFVAPPVDVNILLCCWSISGIT